MPEPIVFVVASPRYGSAIMRGYQQAESVNRVGGEARVLSAVADRPSLLALRDHTVVLVKDAVVDDELVLGLSVGGNRLVWDAVDYCAHKPPIALPETPAEHLAGRAATELVSDVLAMTAATEEVVAATFPGVHSIHRVDHQVDTRLACLDPVGSATAFSAAYVGAPENLPDWADAVPDVRRLITTASSFMSVVAEARNVPVHVDIRNPTRDRRDHKPWTKVATTLAMGAAPIAEDTAANRSALGTDYALLFDGSLIDFERCLVDAEAQWEADRFESLRPRFDELRHRSHPDVGARHLLELIS